MLCPPAPHALEEKSNHAHVSWGRWLLVPTQRHGSELQIQSYPKPKIQDPKSKINSRNSAKYDSCCITAVPAPQNGAIHSDTWAPTITNFSLMCFLSTRLSHFLRSAQGTLWCTVFQTFGSCWQELWKSHSRQLIQLRFTIGRCAKPQSKTMQFCVGR